MANGSRGRPRKYSEYEKLVKSFPKGETKRAKYLNGIGVFRGARGDAAWIKVRLPQGAVFKGKVYQPGASLEIKLGRLDSFSWEQLVEKQSEMQGRADRGEPLEEAPTILFSEWSAEWLKRAKSRLRGHGTVKVHIDNQFDPTFGNTALNAITTQSINNWIALRLETAKPSTVKREIGTLGSILSSAVKAGHIEKNPSQGTDVIKGVFGRQRFLSLEELTKLLVSAEGVKDWLPDFISWCVHSGMRKGEVLNILWSDIQALGDGRLIAMVRTSKADQPRMVVCTKTMSEIIERQKARKVDEDDRVFPISNMTLKRKWGEARKKAKLEDVTMHDLRRTHSTLAAAAGVDLRTLAGRIGHTDLTMLQKHYAAIVGSAAVEAVDIIQNVFDTGPKEAPTDKLGT